MPRLEVNIKNIEVHIKDIVRDIKCSECGKPVDWREKEYRDYIEIEVGLCDCNYRKAYDDGVEDGYATGHRDARETHQNEYRNGFSDGLASHRIALPKKYFITTERK